MLTEKLIKYFIEDLKADGVEDITTYEYGFRAGMAALSDILSENIDNQPQLFTYLGMAVIDGAQWINSLSARKDDVAPIFEAGTKEEPDFDFIPTFDTPADFVRKYKGNCTS